MHGLAAERVRLLAADPEPERPGRDPDELERQAAELRAEEAGLTERLADGREALAESVAERTMAEAPSPPPSAGSPTRPAPPRAARSAWPGCAAWSTPRRAAPPRPARRSTG